VDFCIQPSFAADRDYIRATEQKIQEENAQFKNLQETIHRYQTSLPFRLYYSIKRVLGKM
jgi:hypothetical protein